MLLGGKHTCSLGSVTGTQWPKEGPGWEILWTQGGHLQKDSATLRSCKRAEANGPAKGLKQKVLKMTIHMEKTPMKEKKWRAVGMYGVAGCFFCHGLGRCKCVCSMSYKLESLCCSYAQSQQLQNLACWKIGPAKRAICSWPCKEGCLCPS